MNPCAYETIFDAYRAWTMGGGGKGEGGRGRGRGRGKGEMNK